MNYIEIHEREIKRSERRLQREGLSDVQKEHLIRYIEVSKKAIERIKRKRGKS